MIGKNKADKNNRKQQIVSQWYEEHYNLLIARANKLVQDEELAKDMVHNTFVRVINNFDTIIQLSDKARAVYIMEANRSVCLDYLRKHRKELVMMEKLDADIWDRNVVSGRNSYSYVELLVDLERSLSKLKERDRVLILGRYVFQLPEQELAKLVNLKPRSVHSALARAVERLTRITGEEVQKDEKK